MNFYFITIYFLAFDFHSLATIYTIFYHEHFRDINVSSKHIDWTKRISLKDKKFTDETK